MKSRYNCSPAPLGYAALEFVEEPLRCPEGSRAVESANIGFLNAATPQTKREGTILAPA